VIALLPFWLAWASSCRGSDRDPRPARSAAPATAAPASAEAPIVRKTHRAMGTIWELQVAAPSSDRLDRTALRAFAEIDRLEQVLSEWRPDSEISAVNRAAGHEAVHVGPDLLANVREGLWSGRETEGAFDITWAALHGVWDFRADPPRVPDPRVIAEKVRLIDYRQVTLDEAAGTVKLAREGMAMGLGGIAKGYALDRAGAILEGEGLADFVLSSGGQVLVSGHRGDRPWRVGIRNPRGDDYFASFEMTSDGSVGTAGDYERFFLLDGVRYHHIIDTRPGAPARGMPARGVVSATVVASTGLRADAIDTGLFVLGVEKGLALAERLGLEAVMIDDRMHVFATPGIRGRLHSRPLSPPSGP
jgi:thiamine biosynthesis lipoprotein